MENTLWSQYFPGQLTYKVFYVVLCCVVLCCVVLCCACYVMLFYVTFNLRYVIFHLILLLLHSLVIQFLINKFIYVLHYILSTYLI